jgi:hypothetical protein
VTDAECALIESVRRKLSIAARETLRGMTPAERSERMTAFWRDEVSPSRRASAGQWAR